MKKTVFILSGFLLLTLLSFTNTSIIGTTTKELLISEALIGNWSYQSVTHNGKITMSNSCDALDMLKLNPNGNFESLQHINIISAMTGIGTFTNCNPIKTNGNWSITSNNTLICNDKTMEIIEITKNTLKLKSVVTRTTYHGKLVKDVYIDNYKRQ